MGVSQCKLCAADDTKGHVLRQEAHSTAQHGSFSLLVQNFKEQNLGPVLETF